jgi:hypothetical protein
MALAIDQTPALVETLVAAAVTTGTFTTGTSNEVVIAMCASDGFFSGAGTTFTISDNFSGSWNLIKRNNTTKGTCEAWYALVTSVITNGTVTATHSNGTSNQISLQVITLSGHNTSTPIGNTDGAGITSAALTDSISTFTDNSWVFASTSEQGDNVTTAVGSGQTKISQSTASATHGPATYWRQTSTTTPSGGSVTMNLTTPATSTADMIIFEIVPPGGVTTLAVRPTADNTTPGDTETESLISTISISFLGLVAGPRLVDN